MGGGQLGEASRATFLPSPGQWVHAGGSLAGAHVFQFLINSFWLHDNPPPLLGLAVPTKADQRFNSREKKSQFSASDVQIRRLKFPVEATLVRKATVSPNSMAEAYAVNKNGTNTGFIKQRPCVHASGRDLSLASEKELRSGSQSPLGLRVCSPASPRSPHFRLAGKWCLWLRTRAVITRVGNRCN